MPRPLVMLSIISGVTEPLRPSIGTLPVNAWISRILPNAFRNESCLKCQYKQMHIVYFRDTGHIYKNKCAVNQEYLAAIKFDGFATF